MKSLQTLLTLLLVAIWPLATSHCDLEQLPGFAFLACSDEVDATSPHKDNQCETDNCASVESGLYKIEDTLQSVPTPPLVTSEFLTTVELETIEPVSLDIAPLDRIAPELPKSWQFSFRTALPPRAPSLVS